MHRHDLSEEHPELNPSSPKTHNIINGARETAALRTERDQLQATVAMLAGALMPLAALADQIAPTFMGYQDGHHDNEPLNGFQPRITVGHVRQAASALSSDLATRAAERMRAVNAVATCAETLNLFINLDGSPCDGFRFREEAIKLHAAVTVLIALDAKETP
jgi:hypothetical protein